MKQLARPTRPEVCSRVALRASTRVLALLLGALLASLWLEALPSPVHAEPVDEARILFDAGVAAFKAERWREARDYFRRSAALYEKPTTLFNLAIVEVKLGLGTEALATLTAFERIATSEHDGMRHGAGVLRSEAEALVRKQREAGAMLGEVHDSLLLSGEAAALFEAGRQAYWAGRYADALQYFERAYELSERGELLYDIGAAADRLRNDARALSALEAFLAAEPSSPLAGHVRSRVEVLRRVVAERDRSAAARALATPPLVSASGLPAAADSRRPRSRAAWPLIGVGSGLVAGGAGSFLWWLDRQRNYDRCAEAGDDCTNLGAIERQRRSALAVTGVLGASGVALLATGVALKLRSRAGLSVALAPGPAGSALWLSGRF
jgi:tetratricopeptide (TPR) repeat protein